MDHSTSPHHTPTRVQGAAESKTPLTDDMWIWCDLGGDRPMAQMVKADFARKLETDRADLLAALEGMVRIVTADGKSPATGALRCPNPSTDGRVVEQARAAIAKAKGA